MQTYRSRSSQIWGWIAIGLGAAIALASLTVADLARPSVGLGLGVALAASGVAIYLRPSIGIGADAVELRNVVTTVTVPFTRLDSIETRWSLELVGDDGKRAGAMGAPTKTSRQRHAEKSAGEVPETVEVVKGAWDAWRRGGGTSSAVDGPSFTTRPDPVGIAWVIVAVAGAVVGLFL
ncbi:hypothetical protein [Demequina activiva]|uniref:PH domain-containing protein n=1 Tax=Demequina activiva TaxID=1582364 RepID=A0A919UIP3_9MICO|nr:hypothetical protein [Demequina activiva]GIG53576.1 hypothetical protein Dac01nite_03280 [Demequina activiva]